MSSSYIYLLVRIASEASDESYIKVVCDDTSRCHCPADSLLSRERDEHDCQHGQPCAERTITSTSPYIYTLAVLALTGFDTVSYLFDIGTAATALYILTGGRRLIDLGQPRSDEDKLTSDATTFVAACYGSKGEGDMITHHYQMDV